MSAKSQHKNIMLAVLGFAVVVVIVALIGLIASTVIRISSKDKWR